MKTWKLIMLLAGISLGASVCASASNFAVASSSPVAPSTATCHINILVHSQSYDQVTGYVTTAPTATIGFQEAPYASSTVGFYATSGTVTAHLDSYSKAGQPIPVHGINVTCVGKFSYPKSCDTTPPVDTLTFWEPKPGIFTCFLGK